MLIVKKRLEMSKLFFLVSFFIYPFLVLSNPNDSIKIVFLGNSLTIGYGIKTEKSYPMLMKSKWKKEGKKVEVINASISGSTTASGISRLNWQLKGKPNWIFIALGANDGLRGVPVKETSKNLEKMIDLAQKNKISVILAGIKVPPNYGKKYEDEFNKIFPDLSKKFDIDLIPFILDGVAGEPTLNQDDGIHPNEKGHEVMAQKIKKQLDKILWP